MKGSMQPFFFKYTSHKLYIVFLTLIWSPFCAPFEIDTSSRMQPSTSHNDHLLNDTVFD